ncbi:MAG: carbon starvation protein A [Anaerolineales bacterium]|nr:carbon starvation protein A [Anaerolineales bacterium]NUQ83399.1 carbon starvation protein A [Anaerolineales bacterium]
MNTLWIVVIAAIVIYVAYNFYAKRIDRDVIQSDAKKATPAKMYMDGVDFMPTSRNVLYGYHFKSIAAAGPIVGPITAANLWGWAPSLLWLLIGVSFIGWVSDYSAIMVAVRNDGNSLSAISHKLIAPRTRTILFTFIFFYLLLVAGAFMGIMSALMVARPDVPFGIIMLGLMGLLAGQMLYKWKMDLILVTAIVVIVTVAAMVFGPFGSTINPETRAVQWVGPINGAVVAFNNAVNNLTGGNSVMTVFDPTNADPRIPPPNAEGVRPTTAVYDAATGAIKTMPAYLFWALFILAFSYLAATLPIWRFAQPVNYIGFWITLLTIGLSALGAVLAPILGTTAVNAAGETVKVATFQLKPLITWGFAYDAAKAWQPLWPMLFVTIACGSISGWHALIGSIGTARQLEYETDGLPVGGGAMFTENTLGLLSLVAVSIVGTGGGAGRFAAGVGTLLTVLFGPDFRTFGTALGFGAFMVIVLTVTQLIFRVMRVTLSEWVGDAVPVFKNMHVSTVTSMVLTMLLVLTGTWVYLWQLFGAANQLMAALSLLIVTVWLREQKKNPAFALWPTLFMYITTLAATLVTARNLFVTIVPKGGAAATGAWAMIVIAGLLFVTALFIGWDGYKAYQRYASGGKTRKAAAATD